MASVSWYDRSEHHWKSMTSPRQVLRDIAQHVSPFTHLTGKGGRESAHARGCDKFLRSKLVLEQFPKIELNRNPLIVWNFTSS
jgi:hypothetical protein